MNSQSFKNFPSLKFISKKRRKERLLMVLLCLFIMAITTGLIVYAMRNTANFFRTPSEITKEDILTGRVLRLGGIVEKGTVEHNGEMQVTFFVIDHLKHEKVVFNGLLPDLFREGQSVIVEGYFDKQGLFIGKRVLAKHDETYMSKETADRLKKHHDIK
ncbi:cytochrome c maturation protein CcmE [Bartonella bacilliformis]|uniref:Cytochrome c-type biogenesis protein CcmE n=2 Tax=Bartonella bacilliformis TaxID=774 RepID=CCME_BARBK|nr:cytochrome c maturation protein CcmE [Bartonella bacilliformis]A1URZ6.1 RecName: Full=Cytochrome c-type biogenesis protein CcmE; AltName: Full=Cytochrome c maturation protein E; AltName: Full=Heme chaperone CcmE [Bartonella bacilliformis KC583]ABM45347.1 cytochrome c-type biogenesis protein CycJ [Bartonella bacilliformis KC583]AMG85587.1 cytochrome c-type biogenesis protein CcmE [Bartonella bacilliformis]KZM37892.1 cytochrome c biogenesis protein CcmE [Bartonella bacilliformis]KZN21942.1 cy